MRAEGIHVGTSGWTYDDWSGPFYPSGVRGGDRLSYYSERFDTVEANVTFYRSLTSAMISAWNRRLGEDFHLVLKGPRLVTHLKRLRGVEEVHDRFFERALELDRLKVVLWQLPPSLKQDLDRLDRFLGLLPADCRHAVEFRDESWWDDDTTNVLSAHDAAFVAVSHPELPERVPVTTDILYLRFHGRGRDLYRYDYSQQELAGWVGRIAPHLPERTLYAFFNNDVGANAPKNALSFLRMLE